MHPSTRRSSSGFAGLRLVPDAPPDDETGPVFTVTVRVDGGIASIDWDPKTPDLRHLSDVGDVIAAAFHALMTDQDVDGRVQAAYERKRGWREHAEAKAAEFERTHPWVCACGHRCKSPGGLATHRRAGDPRCVG